MADQSPFAINVNEPGPKPPDANPPKTKQAFGDDAAGSKSEPAMLHIQAGVTALSLPVPCNVYGGAAMCPMLVETPTIGAWFETCGQAYLRLFISHAIQTMLIFGLAQLDAWQNDTIITSPGEQCYTVQPHFFIPCVWIFIIAILKELIDTMDMTDLILFRVPTVQGRSQVFKYDKGADGSLSLSSGGMNKARKAVVFVLILGPRFALAIAMMCLGGSFLLTAGSNTNLIMNCLAATFILDSDELIFAYLTPARLQRTIEAIPPFETDALSPLGRILQRCSMLFKLTVSVIVLVVLFLMSPKCALDPCTDSWKLNQTCPLLGTRSSV